MVSPQVLHFAGVAIHTMTLDLERQAVKSVSLHKGVQHLTLQSDLAMAKPVCGTGVCGVCARVCVTILNTVGQGNINMQIDFHPLKAILNSVAYNLPARQKEGH